MYFLARRTVLSDTFRGRRRYLFWAPPPGNIKGQADGACYISTPATCVTHVSNAAHTPVTFDVDRWPVFDFGHPRGGDRKQNDNAMNRKGHRPSLLLNMYYVLNVRVRACIVFPLIKAIIARLSAIDSETHSSLIFHDACSCFLHRPPSPADLLSLLQNSL
jgi:hypothetical protein